MRPSSVALVGLALGAVLTGGVASAALLPAAAPSRPSAPVVGLTSGLPQLGEPGAPALPDEPVRPQAPAAGSVPLAVPAVPVPVPPVAAPAPVVAPLGALAVPDVLVRATTTLTPEQLAALQAVTGVTALAVLDAGTVDVAGQPAQVVGVDPSQFRALTPPETAQSDGLWQAVARGELAPTFGLAEQRGLPLGEDVMVTATGTDRVGAVASFGLPGVDVVVDRSTASSYGLAPSTAAVLSAPERGVAALADAVRAAVGDGVEVVVLRPEPPPPPPSSGKATTYRELYVQAAERCPGMSWQLLAAIGQVESGHGVNNGPSTAGALGPMQFLPSTWAFYGADGDGDGDEDINDPFDAIPGAADYLCRNGAGRGGQELYNAVFAYNRLDSYVQEVLALAEQYR